MKDFLLIYIYIYIYIYRERERERIWKSLSSGYSQMACETNKIEI